jgi:hypothetical protein
MGSSYEKANIIFNTLILLSGISWCRMTDEVTALLCASRPPFLPLPAVLWRHKLTTLCTTGRLWSLFVCRDADMWSIHVKAKPTPMASLSSCWIPMCSLPQHFCMRMRTQQQSSWHTSGSEAVHNILQLTRTL